MSIRIPAIIPRAPEPAPVIAGNPARRVEAMFEHVLATVRPERLIHSNAPRSTEITVTYQRADPAAGRRARCRPAADRSAPRLP